MVFLSGQVWFPAYMQHCPDPCNTPVSLAGSSLAQRRQTLHNRSRCSALTYECGQHDGHGINGHSVHLFVVCQHTHHLLVGKPAGSSSSTWQDSKPLNAGLHNIHAVAVKHACTATFKVQLIQPVRGRRLPVLNAAARCWCTTYWHAKITHAAGVSTTDHSMSQLNQTPMLSWCPF